MTDSIIMHLMNILKLFSVKFKQDNNHHSDHDKSRFCYSWKRGTALAVKLTKPNKATVGRAARLIRQMKCDQFTTKYNYNCQNLNPLPITRIVIESRENEREGCRVSRLRIIPRCTTITIVCTLTSNPSYYCRFNFIKANL